MQAAAFSDSASSSCKRPLQMASRKRALRMAGSSDTRWQGQRGPDRGRTTWASRECLRSVSSRHRRPESPWMKTGTSPSNVVTRLLSSRYRNGVCRAFDITNRLSKTHVCVDCIIRTDIFYKHVLQSYAHMLGRSITRCATSRQDRRTQRTSVGTFLLAVDSDARKTALAPRSLVAAVTITTR